MLRDGKNAAANEPMAAMTRQTLVSLMIGREERIARAGAATAQPPDVVLEARGLATSVGHRDIDFTLHRGEILGLYGLVGAGRSELAKAIIGDGASPAASFSSRASRRDPRHARGAAPLPHRLCQRGPQAGGADPDPHGARERRDHGLAAARRRAWPDRAATRNRARSSRSSTSSRSRTPSLDQTVGNLSGGNQQKVSIAKWLAADAEVLIVDEPTVGIDIKTKAYLHELIRELAADGVAILLITSDMPEMVTVADRILVMHGFRIIGEVANDRHYEPDEQGDHGPHPRGRRHGGGRAGAAA